MSAEDKESSNTEKPGRVSRMPSNSPLYEKVIPGLLIGMAILMGALILFAVGILLGIISF